ncbi:MAG: redoxin domain-containing protein [Rhodanobacteraceae bacterium]|nr:redoxin domain-containing protein [Rhodanobacteraceae bacterium]
MSGDIYLQELPAELEWVNTDEAIRLSQLRGKAVLLNFFTGSSIACEQQVQELRLLETKFHDGLVVLGIHTAKHPVEADSKLLLKTCNRWNLRHPVASDREWLLWRQLGIETWPTAVLIDCEGRLVGVYPGEGRRAELEVRIQEILDQAAEKELRSYESAPTARKPEPRGALRFPTRLVASGAHLYVADSGYNRVLEVGFDGRINRQFGSGNPGHWDAKGIEAGFRCPVGLALTKDFLMIADTGNHAIRRVRLMSGDVDTIAGNGLCGRPSAADISAPRATPLASPVDVTLQNDRLYIAMAGSHQIWQLDLGRGSLSLLVGNGREDAVDGTGTFSSFAQPTALAVLGESLFVLDAATSSLRKIRLEDGRVSTLVPGGLYSDGSTDGLGMAARMCHPTAIHADTARNVLWIADTLNNKLRVYGLAKNELKTLNINYNLQSPAGVCVAQGAVFIANTHAHEILKLDLKTGRLARLAIST